MLQSHQSTAQEEPLTAQLAVRNGNLEHRQRVGYSANEGALVDIH